MIDHFSNKPMTVRTHFLDGPHPMQSIIESTMRRCPQFAGCTFQFRNVAGNLHIQGTVKTYYEKQLAQESIKTILGESNLVNDIVVIPD